MADTLMINVDEDLDIDELCKELANSFRAKGFLVYTCKMKNGIRIIFDKDCGGVNTVFGLGKGITATIVKKGDLLTVNYTDAEWTGKIVAFIIGWFIFVPWITAIIGTVGQLDLPKMINGEIMILANR